MQSHTSEIMDAARKAATEAHTPPAYVSARPSCAYKYIAVDPQSPIWLLVESKTGKVLAHVDGTDCPVTDTVEMLLFIAGLPLSCASSVGV